MKWTFDLNHHEKSIKYQMKGGFFLNRNLHVQILILIIKWSDFMEFSSFEWDFELYSSCMHSKVFLVRKSWKVPELNDRAQNSTFIQFDFTVDKLKLRLPEAINYFQFWGQFLSDTTLTWLNSLFSIKNLHSVLTSDLVIFHS